MDRVIFLGCVLLLGLGVMTGLGLGSSVGLSASIRSAFELLSFAGTAVTAVVALVALTSWQTQFRHSEKWKAIKDFQDALDGGEAAHNYLLCAFSMTAQNQNLPWHERRMDLTQEFQEKQKAWFAQCSATNRAWSQIILLFDEQELASFKGDQEIQEEIEKTISLVLEGYFQSEPNFLVNTYSAVISCSSRARNYAMEQFAQATTLKKNLVR
ncbi:hypothetical protein [Pseudomonas mosselii]|uniref:DUF4760 domain-containing protein n=1 Tax=Pseudomonas mosselii TaxID=78327 RepID=A0A7W2Q1C1_9PSED|nr:hypothetical protein [Pseudomonas mosselii]MBA6068358.1 hypothetical protein [Pseudomonas mosselii]